MDLTAVIPEFVRCELQYCDALFMELPLEITLKLMLIVNVAARCSIGMFPARSALHKCLAG